MDVRGLNWIDRRLRLAVDARETAIRQTKKLDCLSPEITFELELAV